MKVIYIYVWVVMNDDGDDGCDDSDDDYDYARDYGDDGSDDSSDDGGVVGTGGVAQYEGSDVETQI